MGCEELGHLCTPTSTICLRTSCRSTWPASSFRQVRDLRSPPTPSRLCVLGWGQAEGGAGLLSTSLEGLGGERALPGTSPEVRTAISNVVSLAVFQPQMSNTTDPEKFLKSCISAEIGKQPGHQGGKPTQTSWARTASMAHSSGTQDTALTPSLGPGRRGRPLQPFLGRSSGMGREKPPKLPVGTGRLSRAPGKSLPGGYVFLINPSSEKRDRPAAPRARVLPAGTHR